MGQDGREKQESSVGRYARQLSVVPLLLVYLVSDREVIRYDAGRWSAIHSTRGRCFDSPEASTGELLLMLGLFAEYRSLFYFRASRSRTAAKVACKVASLIWRSAPGLLIGGGCIGPGLYIEHGFGTILAAEKIGRDCWINQDVTLARDSARGACVVGDRCFIRMGAKVLGGTTIGDDSEVGANAVVTKDVPSGVVVAGVPASVIGPNRRLSVPDVNAGKS